METRRHFWSLVFLCAFFSLSVGVTPLLAENPWDSDGTSEQGGGGTNSEGIGGQPRVDPNNGGSQVGALTVMPGGYFIGPGGVIRFIIRQTEQAATDVKSRLVGKSGSPAIRTGSTIANKGY